MAMRFEETRSLSGFDRHSNPMFQMVPKNGERTILIKDSLNCNVELNPNNRNVLRVDLTRNGLDSILRLKGQGRPGLVQIKVIRPAGIGVSREELILNVSVKDCKLISTAFIYMKTNGPESTRRDPSDVDLLRYSINNILERQCNLKVDFHERTDGSTRPFVFSTGPEVGNEVDHSEHFRYVNILGPNENPEFQFVFVREFSGDREGELEDGNILDHVAGTAYRCCVIQDPKPNGASQGILLSHELGHHILRNEDGDGHHPNPNNLMYWSATSGILTAEQINIFNPTGLRIPSPGDWHKPSKPSAA